MVKQELLLKGKNLKLLKEILQNNINECFIYENENMCQIITEKEYYLLNTSILTNIILIFEEEGFCQIDMISGGGSLNPMNSAGIEEGRHSKIMGFIEESAEKNNWFIERK